jgi:ornithine cyclodeaminase
LLAREDAGDLALLGAGEQARSHLEAMSLCRPLRRIRVWARQRERATAFAKAEGDRLGLRVEVAASVRDAVVGADIICTLTGATDPILPGAWIEPGAHVNAVGSSQPTKAEIDIEAVVKARLFVDRRESTLNEAGEVLTALKAGAITDQHILGEIGEVASGSVAGRIAPNDVTLYKSLGVSVQDLASAHHVLLKARAQGIGQTVTL